MASPSVARLVEAPPKYVRLPPGASGYTVELSTDVLQRLHGDIVAAAKLGIETGGLLLGSWEPAPRPIVRIEDFELIAAQPEDGPLYLLSPQQQEQFSARLAAVARERADGGSLGPVGFFRSHIRSGPLALSLADKGLLWKQFRSENHLALLIEAGEPHKASLFLSAGGQIVLHSSLPLAPPGNRESEPVRKNTAIAIAETPLEVAEPASVQQFPKAKQRRNISPELLALCSVLLFAIGIVLWPAWEATFGGPWAIAASTDMGLALQRRGHNLQVTWNREMPEIARAEGATLTLVNGPHRTKLHLGKDDLKFGTVAYAYKGGLVQADLVLKMQDATSLAQSASWKRR